MNKKLNTAEFLLQLRDMGVELWVDEDKLRFNAPNDVITSSLRKELSRRKAEIMRLFADSASTSGSEKIPLQPVSGDGVLPLSFAQQRLWFLSQMEPNSTAYVISLGVRMQGKLNVEAFERSMNEILRRHEVLRTTFKESDGRPEQVVSPPTGIKFPLVDLQELPVDERETEVQQLINEEVQHPFNLAKGPLFRVKLVRLGEDEHVFFLAMHHIIFDGWSADILFKELGLHYKSFLSGKPSSLPELPVQYADFAHWQREWLQAEALERQLAYWKRQLGGDLPVLQLPHDRPRPASQAYRGTSKSFVLSERLKMGLKQLSRDERVTMFMTLLAAFYTLLYRYTGQEDITVGSPVANRTQSEIENLIGFFVNTLVLRGDMSGSPSFTELLGRVREVTLAASKYQDLPFEKIVEELQPVRDMSYSPLFQVMFVLQNMPGAELQLPGLSLSSVSIDSGTSMFDLTLFMWERDQGLSGGVEYNTDLFDDATIARLIGHYETLLESIVADPEQRISDVQILTDTERQQLLIDWNDTSSKYPRDRCIHQLFEEQVEQIPEAVAVVNGDEQLTYRELNARANHLAHYLRKRGVGPEVLVGICVQRSLEMVVGLLGILKAGGAYVPLDPAYPRERLAFMLKDSQVPVLLTQNWLLDELPELQALVICLDKDWKVIAKESDENSNSSVSVNNPAYLIYTSGSTGTPKGVLGLHRGAVNRFHWMWQTYPFKPNEICCQKTSLNFLDSLWEIFGPLLQGIPTVIIPDEAVKDPQLLVQTLASEGVTRIVLVPSLLQVILDVFDDIQSRLRHLNIWVTSGEMISGELAQSFKESMPEATLLNLYGSSEVSADCTWYDTHGVELCHNLPIGRPIANTQVYILDAQLQPVPIGVAGQLYTGGDGLARGYLNRQELTAENFIPDPFSEEPAARLYKTGDLARYLPDGNIEYLGRRDHQVKVRGFRIELAEIETVLSQHASVREAFVLAIEDKALDKLLVAYVTADRDKVDKISELRNFLKQRLPDYMVPQAYVFLDALPLTPSGKVDRQALSKHDFRRSTRENELVAPKTATEKFIVGIWKKLLGVNEIGIYDNFFELGGHSLLATRVISHVRDTFQVELPVHCFFDAPTVAGLTEVLEIYETVPGRTSAIAQILEKIDAMDAQEVRKMLHDKKKGAVCDL